VARLLTDEEFERQVTATFEKPRKVVYHLHPPLLRQFGFERKLALGPWFKPVLKALASFRGLRGTAFDPFGWMPSRRLERELIGWYRETVSTLLPLLDRGNLALAADTANAPAQIRGYEAVKEESVKRARAFVEERLAAFAKKAAA
jgi:indolepyruvate ferredoxin oxidoreductase